MPKILHFADAHIDMINYGRHDPQTGLPMRVMDFLKSLDTIVDTAIDERVDLVIFAGDAYKDRNPAPTFQREWGRRIMRLSRAGIPTLLLIGNHDISPALGRANALDQFDTLEVPHVHVIERPALLAPTDLEGIPVQVIALPWISRSGMMAHLGLSGGDPAKIYEQLEERLTALIHNWLEEADPNLPVILAAHASVQGAKYGGERAVLLGGDLVLPGSLVRNPRLDYVALGHIHKPQNLNANPKKPSGSDHPPVIYPGSIERIDFGEAHDDKFFIIAQVEKGETQFEWRKLSGIRPFIDGYLRVESKDDINAQMCAALPDQEQLRGAIARLVVEYPRDWEPLIDEAAVRSYAAECFEFHLVKRPLMSTRIRLPEDKGVGSLSQLELLDLYWRSAHVPEEEAQDLNRLANQVIKDVEGVKED